MTKLFLALALSGGDWVLALLLLASIVSVAVMIERYWLMQQTGRAQVAEESERLLAGAVGDAAAIKFLRFIADADMPVIADVLDGKVKFTPDHRQDRTVAVYASCAALVADPGADKTLLKTRLPRMWKLLDSQLGHAADLTIPAARTLVAHKLQTGVPESSKVMLALHPIMEAAGLLRR